LNRQIPWPRIIAEGVVIVASILLALATDAWREDRRERAEEGEALGRLDAEFAAVDSVMRDWRDNHRAILEAGQALLEHTGPEGSSSLSADSIGHLLGVVQFTWTLDPPSGVLSSLVASGQLGLIQSQDLRVELASWQGLLDDVHGDETWALQLVSDRLDPYLDENVSFRTVLAQSDDYSTTPSDFDDGFEAILAQRHFENLIEGRVYNTYWTLRSYDEALDGLARIRQLLRAELARWPS
jgi:hypothetical protein